MKPPRLGIATQEPRLKMATPATEHAAVPAAELEGLPFDPEAVAAELEDASAEEALRWALDIFSPRMYIACSFQKDEPR